MSERRRVRVRLEISREAARLFWEQGVAATSGEQIAEAVGLSVRTLWRNFRNKESCAEPVLARTAERFVDLMRSWPADLSLEQHFAVERPRMRRDPEAAADDLPALRMIVLGLSEPSVRTAWLMVCDRAEHDLRDIIATRLKGHRDDIQIRMHAAAVTASVRVLNEDVGATVLAPGADPALFDQRDATDRLTRAIRTATHGALGDAVATEQENHRTHDQP